LAVLSIDQRFGAQGHRHVKISADLDTMKIGLRDSDNRKSLTMSALSSPVFVFSQIFCHLFSFCEHTTTFTPKSGLVRFALPLADDHGSFINLSVGFSPT